MLSTVSGFLSKKKAHVSFPDVLIIITPIPYCSLCHRQYLRNLEPNLRQLPLQSIFFFIVSITFKIGLEVCVHFCFVIIVEMKIYPLSEDENTDIVSLVHYFSI